jgi:hydroxypyruvate reductase
VHAAIDAAGAARAVSRALDTPSFSLPLSRPVHVLAAGKAASSMATAVATDPRLQIRTITAIGTHAASNMPPHVEWHEAAHPVPDDRSVRAATRALDIASRVAGHECLLVLLSGGASAVMALPQPSITLDDKQQTIRTMLLEGADIHALNTVRKHLSAIKGGRLAAACAGPVLTWAVSDVVGDDLSVIGSGPTVPDPSTWVDAGAALRKYGGVRHSSRVLQLVERGAGGGAPETPKPGSAALTRAEAHVIGSRTHAVQGAREAAERLGYRVVTIPDPVLGEAREAASSWWTLVSTQLEDRHEPACVISAGETTVRVTGSGRGGRNQEFVLALADTVAHVARDLVVASVGTDGIDGPTDAAGALVEPTTCARAAAIGLTSSECLADNNSYDFFALLGDLIHLGRTDTNVGDIQVMLAR